MKGFDPEGETRKQYLQLWTNWMFWAVAHPKKRRALVLLGVSDEITAKSRTAGQKTMAPMREMLARIHERGAMRDAPMGLLLALLNSVADATMDFMLEDKKNAEKHCRIGFEALWRMIG